MPNIDAFLDKKYDANNYNCSHFYCDIYRHLTGLDVRQQMRFFLLPTVQRNMSGPVRREFARLDRPQELCVVLMRAPRTQPHVGMWLENNVLHLKESGVILESLSTAALMFKKVGYYKCLT